MRREISPCRGGHFSVMRRISAGGPIPPAVPTRANVGELRRNGSYPSGVREGLVRTRSSSSIRGCSHHQSARARQPLDFIVSGAKVCFRLRDLPKAPRDSCGRLPPFLGDFVERPAVRLESGPLLAERLPALHRDIHILRVQLNRAADSLSQFRGRQRGPAAQERFETTRRASGDSESAAA